MKFIWLLLLPATLFLTACEKEYKVEYRIQNMSDFTVIVEGEVVINTVTQIGPEEIAPGEAILLGTESGVGMSGEEFIANLDNLIPTRINNIDMESTLSVPYRHDPTDPQKWKTIDPVDEDAPAFIILDLITADF